ncbi:class I SAM-dependent methyltransferase [Streptomyces sp. NPDC091377]|uniref:class I SAM-dependent methyltransferase n=1 Tax=Streptomyces sp. NPDC091377 TaxID=3365995 RepID=UPI0038302544
MVDRFYGDLSLAEMYDALHPWGPTDAFCLERVGSAESVADIGCGTGRLLSRARRVGHGGRLTGLDPAAAMLVQARRRTAGVEWVLGDLDCVRWEAEFDLAVMSGQVLQLLPGDTEARHALAALRRALVPGGRLLVDTLDPAGRPWEGWGEEGAREVVRPDGSVVRAWREAVAPVRGERVRYVDRFDCDRWERAQESRGTLRFREAAALDRLLEGAGFTVEERHGPRGRAAARGAGGAGTVTVARRG